MKRKGRMEGDTEIAELESDIRTLRKQLKEKVHQLKTLKKHFQKVSIKPTLLNNIHENLCAASLRELRKFASHRYCGTAVEGHDEGS